MLAFVMVFTGMGIGSWGVDTAWASGWDGTEISEPSKSEDGTYQISSAAELAWFAGLVNGTLEGVEQNLAANAVLIKDIDLNEHAVGIGTKTVEYKGVFDGDGHKVCNLKISEADVTKGIIGFFGKINKASIKQLEIENASVSGDAKGVLVGTPTDATIEKCAVKKSTFNPVNMKTGIICGIAINTQIAGCYSLENILTNTKSKRYIAGLVGQIKASSALYNCYVAALQYDNTDGKITPTIGQAENNTVTNCFFASDNGQETITIGEKKTIAWLKSDEAITALGASYKKDSENKNSGFPVLVYGQKVDKEELKACIDKAETLTDDDVWQEGDRFNGKESEYLPKGSFWAVMTEKLSAAKAVYDSSESTQVAIDTAKDNLQSAIANLIPKSQLNATKLYEAVQSRGNYTEEFLEDCTDVSVAAYRVTIEKAKAYLNSLFDKKLVSAENPNGATKENVIANQEKADGYADELKNFSFLLKEDVTNATWNLKTINGLAKQYDMTENNGKYTEESWNAFVAARKAATEYAQEHPISNSMKAVEAQEYAKLARAFQSEVYGLKSEGKTVTVRFAYTDDYHLRFPNSADKDPTDNLPTIREYELSSGSTVGDLLNQIGYTYNNEKRFESSHYSVRAFFANGTRLYGYTPGVQAYLSETSYVLKDGDEIQLVHMDYPSYPYNYIYRSEVEWDKMAELLGILRLTESEKNAAAGEEIKLMVERTSAHPWTYTGTYSAFEGAVLAAYGPMKEDGSYPQTPILSEQTSDADGTVSMKLYEPGKYFVTAFDPRENNDDKTLYYTGTVAAPYMELTVADADDTSAIRAELKKALDKAYNDCISLDLNYDGTKVDENGKPEPEYFTKEEKFQINEAYEDAAKVLRNSKSTAAKSYQAQQEAIKAIQLIQKTTTEAYDKSLAAFRENLNKLPDDTKLITKSVESIVESLIQTHNSMTAYAKEKLLTKVEKEKYNQVAALQEKLPEAKKYTLRYAVTANTDEAKAEIEKVMKYLHDNPARMDSVSGEPGDGAYTATPYSFNVTDSKVNPLSGICFYGDLTYNAYFHNDKSQRYHASDPKNTLTIDIPGTDCTITDESIYFIKNGKSLAYDVNGSLTLNVDGTTYELKSVTYEGLEESDVAYGTLSCLDFSGYKGKNDQWVNMYFTKAYLGFTMPYNDVTITLNWGPVTSAAELQAAKDSAKSVLDETFAGYEKEKASYSEANWTILENAYNTGKSSIEAATTLDDVASARKTAITTMAKVKKEGTTVSKPNAVGTVYVTVENTTFPKSKWEGKTYWEGQLVDNMPIEITNDSTMMSCVVEALEKVGATQIGAENNYISSITDKNGNELGEFDGSSQSGWMGTLNDWFNNEGFGNFTVASGALGDGDEIRIMYTTKGYGEDLGGSWANSDTTLKDLSVSGGTLTPSFTSGTSGNSYDYTLLISGKTANIKVTPTAANKNFLTKIFLNEKVTSNVQGSSFYKRTQYIPVTAGDTIYVGCGERRWPSMNNQAGNTQANGGTWYALKVVNSDNAKATIEKAIAELPAADKIKIGNYKNTKDAAKDIRNLYNSLTSSVQNTIDKDKLAKLKAVEEKVKFYTEIDDAKAKLAALTDSSSSSQARGALSAYEKLTKEQKEYITEADAAKFNELAKKYNFSTITGAAAMPESEVVTTGKAGTAVTTSPTTVKMSGTTASVTVKADNQKEILKQAKEKKSAQVVLAIANSDAKGAEKLEMNLDKSFLESLLKDTSAKLVVKTPLGQKTYERDELQKLVNEATGTTVKAEINKDNVDAQTEEPIDDNAAKIAKAKSIVKNMKLTARSGKTAKKNIKAVLKSDAKVKASIKELKDLGFTVKYRFYRSTKKAAGYKAAVTKKTASYTNTSGKKGTKYFYKVQARVYDENGKLVAKTALKQCKYASRTWTK